MTKTQPFLFLILIVELACAAVMLPPILIASLRLEGSFSHLVTFAGAGALTCMCVAAIGRKAFLIPVRRLLGEKRTAYSALHEEKSQLEVVLGEKDQELANLRTLLARRENEFDRVQKNLNAALQNLADARDYFPPVGQIVDKELDEKYIAVVNDLKGRFCRVEPDFQHKTIWSERFKALSQDLEEGRKKIREKNKQCGRLEIENLRLKQRLKEKCNTPGNVLLALKQYKFLVKRLKESVTLSDGQDLNEILERWKAEFRTSHPEFSRERQRELASMSEEELSAEARESGLPRQKLVQQPKRPPRYRYGKTGRPQKSIQVE